MHLFLRKWAFFCLEGETTRRKRRELDRWREIDTLKNERGVHKKQKKPTGRWLFIDIYKVSRLYYTTKAHECHSQEAGGEEGDRSTLQCLRHLSQCQLLAHTCEQYQCQCKTNSCSDSEEHTGQQAWLCAHRQFIGAACYHDSHTEQTAVRRDQWQEHTQCLVQRWRDLLKDNLNHLHEGSNHQDKQDGLQEAQTPCIQELLQEIGYQCCQCHDKQHSSTHTKRSVDFLTYAQEWTDTQELAQYDIINEYRRDKYQEIYHNLISSKVFVPMPSSSPIR